MARRIRSAQLESRSARLRLAIRRKVYTQVIGRGLRIGYRRCKTEGTWSVIKADGRGGSWIDKIEGIVADDYRDADGVSVLDYWQAVKRVREVALGENEDIESPHRPVTIDMAIDDFARDLAARGGGSANATWLRTRLPASMRSKVLALVDAREFRKWRDDLVETGELERSSINRLMKSAKACFNHAAALDERIGNRSAWATGLRALPDAERSRNDVITEAEVRAAVRACYASSPALGVFAEVGACTGARPSQIARLKCRDVQKDRLLMPSSRKGRSRREVTRKPIPIPANLAARLADIVKGRPPDALLLTMPSGEPWRVGDHYPPFQAAVKAAGLTPKVTFYAFRHTHITNMLLRNVPVTLVADACDTSPAMIKKTYAAHIADHGETLLRANMLDLAESPAANVVSLTRTKAG